VAAAFPDQVVRLGQRLEELKAAANVRGVGFAASPELQLDEAERADLADLGCTESNPETPGEE
jgi:hypothetical protein